MPTLSVITLTVPQRQEQLELLKAELAKQIGDHDVEHFIQEGLEPYGTKMRMSLEAARGQYVCWMDDDDWPSPDYISELVNGIGNSPDVITFGSYTPGSVSHCWLRANREDNCESTELYIVKTANHYCAWKREIALSAPWLPRWYGAEVVWYTLLSLGYPNLVEHHIPKILHEYRYDSSKTLCQNRKAIDASLKNEHNHVKLLRMKNTMELCAAEGIQPVKGFYDVVKPDGTQMTVSENDVTMFREIVFT